MTKQGIVSSLAVFDYERNKMCDLYDSGNDLAGQAYNISFTISMTDSVKSLTFTIPFMIDKEKNFRWDYMKSEYLIRFIYNGKTEWYVAQKPKKSRSSGEIVGEVTCAGLETTLKTKNIYMQFDDENGIGTISELADKVLAGTGWHRGHTDPMLEADGETEKIRSLSNGGKTGALGLITTLCNLFKCYPVYNSDSKTVDLYNFNNRDQVLEGTIGKTLESLSVSYNSSDIITRLYVEGEYGDDGYVGIDDVNPTGLPYIFNFDYYREIGVFKQEHETALSNYLSDIASINSDIKENTQAITELSDSINELIGQCDVALYLVREGFTHPAEVYGHPSAAEVTLNVGDDVVVLNGDGKCRYTKVATTPEALIQTGDYGIAKFITKASGSIGAYEVQIEAKEKEIENLNKKINSTSKEEKKAEYRAQINVLRDEIAYIYNGSDISGNLKQTLGAKYIPNDYDGDTDLLNRRIITAVKMLEKWPEFDDGNYATLYAQTFTIGPSGMDFQYPTQRVITFTPIKADGTVLTPALFRTYVSNAVANAWHAGTYDIKLHDGDNLLLRDTEVVSGQNVQDVVADEKAWLVALNKLQSSWDTTRSRYNWFGERSTMDPDGVFGSGSTLVGIYAQMYEVMNTNGYLVRIGARYSRAAVLQAEQDDIESNFIIAMGDMLHDGYINNQNYIEGQETALYNDSVERLRYMSRPSVSYTLSLIRVTKEFGIPIEDMKLNAIFRVHDDDLNVHENLFVTKIKIGVDKESDGSIDVSNQDITINDNDLGALLSRMSQLADLIEQKNTLYERAKAITKNNTLFTDRLNGQIDVLKNQLLSTVSNWYTDEQGNIMFIAADGGSAMMLCGAGFMIASSKDENGDWNWRTKMYHWFSSQKCGIITN